ncbi:HEAT repeat domain-containing protein [Nonomuraea sp. NPDC049709]|uniref:HEAT repeat domain-containing protein n=1 Tax=Nonomuraea sp. NPDC049709 TaxID=3154736 RepID=UPI0034336DA7
MTWIKEPFPRHGEPPVDPPVEQIVDSIHRLVTATGRGRHRGLDQLAIGLYALAADAEPAARAMDVLAAVDPLAWIDLDLAVRRQSPPPPPLDRRCHAAPAAVAQEPATPLAVALAACAWNGRERARAMAHPAMRYEAGLLPLLLVRTTDWVDPVRDRALRVLGEVLADTAALPIAVPVAVRMGERVRGRPALELVRDALMRAGQETLDLVLGCPDARARRFAYDVLIQAGRLDHERLVGAALHEPDQVSRTRCAQALAARAVAEERPEHAVEILDGATAQGRIAALTALVQLGHPEHGPRFLGDNAGMMRLTAQWAVRRPGGEPAELYRERIKAGGATRGLLAGLGDCGTRADDTLVLPYLRDPRPRVRAEAVRTLRRLGSRADVTALLEDPAPVVVRNVVAAVQASGPGVPAERLWALLGTGHPLHVRRAAHRLLVHRDPWSRVRADLLLVRDPDEKLSGRARDDLAQWCRQSSTAPPARLPAGWRAEVEELARAAEGVLSPEDARWLRLTLRLFV